jgi:hypothetical protein
MIPRKVFCTVMLTIAFAASACSRTERTGFEQGGDAPAATSAGPSSPALWEPVDAKFKGCEGG